MTVSRRTLLALGLAGATLLAYLVLWLQVDHFHIGRSDFTSTYMGATLLREGHGASMYDESLQTPLHEQLIAPDHEGNLPFVNAPLAAALALPVSYLGLDGAYRVWSLLQFALVVLAAIIAVRGAPGGRSLDPQRRALYTLGAVACLGTWTLLVQGQWDGVSALGLALAYAAYRKDRLAVAGAVLAATSLLAKPHLALGLAAFVVGRFDRRLIAGAVAGTLGAIALSFAVAGPGGVEGFAGAAFHSTTRWELRNMLSFAGIAGTVAGDSSAAHVIATAGSIACVAAAFALGWSVRRHAGRLEAALAGAAVLSLLASPHAYSHDLALLVPVAAWSLTAAAASGSARLRTWVVASWLAINAAAYVYIISGAQVPLGQLAPWALLAAAGLAIAICRGQDVAARLVTTGAPTTSVASA